ncbi:MAG TPA: phosphoribosylaminoimidazolesuccinocarboxamide synthase, partial [bacterium]|nr:phosphoribosylaminoimidazolesuccinocarboxamide synthase [bacterium]
MGSVKDLTVLKEPTNQALGVGKFTFSDRYSVFDWGEMPDHIPGKGVALNMMAGYNFVELRKAGIPSHFISLYSDQRTDTDDFLPGRPVDTMYVQLTRVLPIDDDYHAYQNEHPHYLLPVEIIFRNGAPRGSSLFKRLDKARGNPARFKSILDSFNLTGEPEPGDMFAEPVYDFTTKLESTDRAISYTEAQRIAGLSGDDFDKLLELARVT